MQPGLLVKAGRPYVKLISLWTTGPIGLPKIIHYAPATNNQAILPRLAQNYGNHRRFGFPLGNGIRGRMGMAYQEQGDELPADGV